MAREQGTAAATIVIRRRAGLPPEGQHPDATRPMTSRELDEACGAADDDLTAVRVAARRAGLTVVEEHGPSRRVRIEGPAATIRAWVDHAPEPLTDIVTAVLGGEPPQAFPRSMVASPHTAGTSYTPLEIARIYGMPDADGTDQTVAILELGGGYSATDLADYFSGLGVGAPTVHAVSVDGATNQPGGDPNGADGEVMLDIEIVGAIAPRASIVVYFAPNTDAGFLDAVATAAHADPPPVAISISWGQSEDQWTAQGRAAMDDAFADAAAMGITVTAAAGDNGSGDTRPSGGPAGGSAGSAGSDTVHADFPASSPHVLGCGGTSLHASDGTVVSEVVWDGGGRGGATGGGVSDVFPLPDYQAGVGVPKRLGGGIGRGVPDVAAVADPQTGYRVLVDGRTMVIGGTSAVAPLWAGLVARITQLSGTRIGLAQIPLYAGVAAQRPAPHLRDITHGTNGTYRAGPGWDPCTGLGVPESSTPQAFSSGTGAGRPRAQHLETGQ